MLDPEPIQEWERTGDISIQPCLVPVEEGNNENETDDFVPPTNDSALHDINETSPEIYHTADEASKHDYDEDDNESVILPLQTYPDASQDTTHDISDHQSTAPPADNLIDDGELPQPPITATVEENLKNAIALRRSGRIATRLPTNYNRLHTGKLVRAFHTTTYNEPETERLLIAVTNEVCELPKMGEPGSEVSAFRPEPRNMQEMLRLPPDVREHWLKSDRSELKNLIDNKTFALENQKLGERIYPTLSLYKVKLNSKGLLDKLKSRIVVRGDLMRDEQPHGDPYSPTASSKTLKMFLADAARNECRVKQIDFVGAFLQAKMKYRMFVMLPEKYGQLFPEYAEWCGKPLLLLKSMYGTTYSGKMWYEELHDFLVASDGLNMQQCSTDPCLYIKYYENGTTLKFLNYVDDGLIFCTDPKMEEEFLQILKHRFELNFMGQAHWFLGMRITQDGDFNITLDQSRYAKNIVQRYLFESKLNIKKYKFKKPLPENFIASKVDCSITDEEISKLEVEFGFQFPSFIGALIYILGTRPDLSFAVHKMARFMRQPGRKHFEAAIHLLHYLRDNSQLGLKFYACFEHSPLYKIITHHKIDCRRYLVTFSDSSWQDCPDTGRSTACYTVTYMGGVVDHTTHMPSIVAMSSAEAEYNAACTACMATDHHRMMLNELELKDPDENPSPIPLLMDSSSAIAMSKSIRDTKRTRHIQRRMHYVREAEEQYRILPGWIDQAFQFADIGTKNTTIDDLESRLQLMMVEVSA